MQGTAEEDEGDLETRREATNKGIERRGEEKNTKGETEGEGRGGGGGGQWGQEEKGDAGDRRSGRHRRMVKETWRRGGVGKLPTKASRGGKEKNTGVGET